MARDPETKLTRRQRLFVESYLTCWNASQAARDAGYAIPAQQGYENLRKPDIARVISERIRDQAMPAGEVLERIAAQARGSMADFIGFEEFEREIQNADGAIEKRVFSTPYIDVARARNQGKLHLLKSFTTGKNGIKVELYDAQAALALLGKAHGLFVDKSDVQMTTKTTVPIRYIEPTLHGHAGSGVQALLEDDPDALIDESDDDDDDGDDGVHGGGGA